MRYDFLITSLYLSIASFLIFAAIYIFTRKELLYGIKLVGVLALANVFFLFGQAAVILSDKEVNMLIFSHIQVFGYVFIPTLWYLVSAQQKHQSRNFSFRKLVILLLIPIIAFIANFTYPWNSTSGNLSFIQTLYFVSHQVVADFSVGPGFIGLVYEKGIVFYILMSYNLIISFFAVMNYLYTYKENILSSKKKALMLMVATSLSMIILILSLIKKDTVLIDFSPLATSFFVFIAFYGLYKYELLDLTPLAYRQVYEDASFPVIILDKSLYILSMNKTAKELYKNKIDFRSQFHLDDFGRWDKMFSSSLKEFSNYEFKVNKNEVELYYHVKLENLHQKAKTLGYLLTYRDITTHKNELKKLEYMAAYDDLTKIFNRRVFYLKATEMFDEAVIHKLSVSFIMFDLDDFKDVNDIYGHQAGDAVLAELAQTCQNEINLSNIFARYGGEEFVIFIQGISPIDAFEIANKLRNKLEKKSFLYMNHKIKVTASFGISGTEGAINKSFEQYLKEADDALYEAKKGGKNQVYLND